MTLSGLLRLCSRQMMLIKIILSRDEALQALLNIGITFRYCRQQETQGKVSSRITSPRLGFEKDSTRQQIISFTIDLNSRVFSYMHFISSYCSFLQVLNLLHCSDSGLILKLIISLDIL
jgi:hypothetical protein